MDIVNRNELNDLLKEETELCISIYIPTYEKGPETEQNQIRFKNALGEAQKQLKAKKDHRIKEDDFLKPARKLLDDSLFWRKQGLGLSVFLSESTFRTYRLPVPVYELTVVKNRFHIKPLLPLLMDGGSFCLVALETITKGGRAYLLSPEEMPEDAPAAAIFRY